MNTRGHIIVLSLRLCEKRLALENPNCLHLLSKGPKEVESTALGEWPTEEKNDTNAYN
jgi:hypothetical protein